MIKNFNETISLISILILVVFTIKFGIGLIFSSQRTDTVKGNWSLLKNYSQNEEE